MTDLATIDAPQEMRESVSACVAWSQSNTIQTADDFQDTGDHLKQIKARLKQADEFFDPAIKHAHELHKMLVGRKKIITEPLAQSERLDKQKMLAYQQAEAEKAEAERRRLQAIADEQARKEREKAEQAAARQRLIEAEAKAKADAARLAAEQASADKKKRLMAEAEAAERKAAAAAVKAEASVEQAAQAVAPVVSVATVAPRVAGVSTKEIWTYEITDASLVPRDYLMIDEKKLAAFARAMKDGVKVPGVRFFAEKTLSSRGA